MRDPAPRLELPRLTLLSPAGYGDAPHAEAPGETRSPRLGLIERLADALEETGQSWCLWKSTLRLQEMLSGRTDLDLLFDRERVGEVRALFGALGFKPFRSHHSRAYPGIEDWIGHDEPSARLVHLHVHVDLLVGEAYIKNHHLPLERTFLTSTRLVDGVRLPMPELELAVLVARTLLKYRDVDVLRDLLRLGRRGGVPADARRELADLVGRIDQVALERLAAEPGFPVPIGLVRAFTRQMQVDPRDARALLDLRTACRHALRPYQRMTTATARMRYFRARAIRLPPLTLITDTPSRRQARRKSPARGGTTIAIIGADGAGKSTVLGHLVEWLAWRIRLRTAYMGSARPSATTAALRVMAHATRAAERRSSRRLGPRHPVTRAATSAATVAGDVRAIGNGLDRLRRSRAGERWAASGDVVLFDRHPFDGITIGGRPVDGPRIPSGGSPVRRILHRLEMRIHRALVAPDHVIALDLPAWVALERKPARDAASVSAKSVAVQRWAEPAGLDVVRIDARQPLDAVLAEARAAVWRAL